MATLTVAALQMAMADDVATNVATAERLVRKAAADGGQLVLIPELFEGPYFCKDMAPEHFDRALPVAGHPTVEHFKAVAAELGVVLPLSIYERANNATYNTVVMVDADGSVLGTYRKSHIPDGPGYEEKFYFRPGNSGFKVWPGAGTTLGVGICWDQWYPEVARSMMLMGAQILFYPTAIGTEPHDPDLDTSRLWRRAMIGHAVSNVVPIVAANRIGTEGGQRFYGHSFICDERGDILAEFGAKETGVLIAELDLAAAQKHRAAFGFFRDRRPELYGRLTQDV